MAWCPVLDGACVEDPKTMWKEVFLGCLLAVSVLSAVGTAQAPPEQGVKYEIVIACPDSRNGACPIRAIDLDDAMGSPAIAVDPDNVNNMIIASLHGQRRDAGPTDRSRSGQPYTTFTSTNHGASWWDNPYTPPRDIGSGAYGEHPAITLDPYGHVFVASLYSLPQGEGRGGPFEFVIAAQKFGSLDDINRNQAGDGSYNVEYIGPVHPTNQIVETWFLHNPITDNVTLVWNERVQENREREEVRRHAQVGDRLDDVLARPAGTSAGTPPPALPMATDGSVMDPASAALVDYVVPARGTRPVPAPSPEQASRSAYAQENATGPAQSVIGIAWTSADVEDRYRTPPAEHAIGPCATSTNPVLSEGWLYIGCVVADEGPLLGNAAARPGDIEMFRMHPDGGAPQHIGTAPIVGGDPKLGVRSDGRIAIMTAEVVDMGGVPRIRLDGAYGQYDPGSRQVDWSQPYAYGDELQILYANTPYVDVAIQDMIYREYSGVIHLILKRVVDWPQLDPFAAQRPSMYKAVVAIDERHGLLAELDLGIGDLVQRLQDPTLARFPESFFDDLADDFLELPPGPYEYGGRPLGDSYQREFYAVGNYGTVDFAEVIEITELRGPAVPALPNPPPPPNPAPAMSSSMALGLAGSLTAASLAAGTVATTRRNAFTRARRKRRTR